MTPMEQEQNKALHSRLREMNQEGSRYHIKKWSNCAEGGTNPLSKTHQLSTEPTICNNQVLTSNYSFPVP